MGSVCKEDAECGRTPYAICVNSGPTVKRCQCRAGSEEVTIAMSATVKRKICLGRSSQIVNEGKECDMDLKIEGIPARYCPVDLVCTPCSADRPICASLSFIFFLIQKNPP